jgi:hypothetical protein
MAPPTSAPKTKSGRSIALVLVGTVLLVLLAWSVIHRSNEGPAIPLPRIAGTCQLGVSYLQLKSTFPSMQLRPFNNDPDFKIASLKEKDHLPENLTGLDLIFYKNTLFFVSQQWETPVASKDLDAWASQYRRWVKEGGGKLQSLRDNASLREWNFQDTSTEMILRELKYNNRTERWQDLRDGANAEAQKAFEKYRIDT